MNNFYIDGIKRVLELQTKRTTKSHKHLNKAYYSLSNYYTIFCCCCWTFSSAPARAYIRTIVFLYAFMEYICRCHTSNSIIIFFEFFYTLRNDPEIIHTFPFKYQFVLSSEALDSISLSFTFLSVISSKAKQIEL